jgi:glycosyltransferase involved in cell wall biosynthesis
MTVHATSDQLVESALSIEALSASRTFRRRHFAIYVPALIGGGAERVAAVLASTLSTAGHKVTLVVDFEAPQNDDFVDASVERLTLAGAHMQDVLQLVKFLKRRQPDIVLAIGAATNIKLVLAHLLGRLIARIKTKIVLSYHGPSWFGYGWLGWSAYPLAFLLTRYASRTICVSDELVRHLTRHWHGSRARITRIYNPIAIDRTKPARDLNALLARPPIIIALGRLCAQKGFDTLIKAMAQLSYADARLAIYGEGPDKVALQQLAERLGVASRIDWAGYILNPWAAYAAARCFVLPSQVESFGNVVVEALASGLPVVSTQCGGPSEILCRGQFGTLVPINDAAALSIAIAKALDQPGDPAPRVARAREFAAPNIASHYSTLFEDILLA